MYVGPNSHKSRKLAQVKFAVGQGEHREFENEIWLGTLFIPHGYNRNVLSNLAKIHKVTRLHLSFSPRGSS